MLSQLKQDLEQYIDQEKQAFYPNFFKTGKGEYGEGDIFLGVTVPHQRIVAKKYKDLSLQDLQRLLDSKIHEHRLTALFILTNRYQKTKAVKQKQGLVNFYLKNLRNINNWDLVDSSSYQILGDWLLDNKRDNLYKLATSQNLWQRRIAIVATFAFIRQGQFTDTVKISEILLSDNHDLIHKAVGWMLREVGKRDEAILCAFLEKHANAMPRTMLRYSIEKLEPSQKKRYMKKKRL